MVKAQREPDRHSSSTPDLQGRVVDGWRGRFLEDFVEGDLYRHPQGRTIGEADNTWFTLLTNNTHQAHYNSDYASRTPYGEVLVNSCLTIAVVTGLTVSDLSENAIANLGWDEVRLPHPVFVGDTLRAESLCIGVRSSASRKDGGIVRFRTRGYNQDGATVITFERTALVYRRASSPRGHADG